MANKTRKSKRPPQPYPKDKSPHHPSALRLRDIHPGVRFIELSAAWSGQQDAGQFLSEPFTVPDGEGGSRILAARVRWHDGEENVQYLDDIGVVPFSDGWDNNAFIIPASKAHLLPTS